MLRRFSIPALALALTVTGCNSVADSTSGFTIPNVAAGDISIETMKDVTRTLSSDEF
jgi:hypothetical protein